VTRGDDPDDAADSSEELDPLKTYDLTYALPSIMWRRFRGWLARIVSKTSNDQG